ncbi:MAG TPA: SMP-30/gluconolactonase/LRE family protein [Candidatus Nitrosotalea sp.]|nr:SMP-30/gluconolactonase/LRE family protein [Candidatus Nitrosotalea sp.]
MAAGAELGEGPIWDVRSGRIAWVDILGRRIHLTDSVTGATESIETPLQVGAIAPRPKGGFVAALQDGFWVIGDGPARRIATVPEARPGLRFNDGKCDPAGRFWAGTMAYDQAAGAAALYRLDAEGRPTRVIDGVTISNGIDWSIDGTAMYYVDSPLHRIDVFDFEPATGEIANRRVAIQIPREAGTPDGLTIDADGGIWVALWGGSVVHRYLDGRLDQVIKLPVSKPTSCAFGGAELDELYVTSASEGLSDMDRRTQPLAGALFRIRTGIRGLPAHSYIGV